MLFYEPREDTFLLIKCMKIKPGEKVLEIGCGSGVVSKKAAEMRGIVFCCDINPYAVEETKRITNGLNVKVFHGNLFDPFENMKFDVILFNPPYVVTEETEEDNSLIGLSWNGGKDGRKLIDPFLGNFDKYLRDSGRVYLIHPDYCNLEKTRKILNQKGFKFDIIGSISFFFERLYCLEIKKRNQS